ncbi:MAG TPA: hypothetical protein ENJ45_04630 [Phaeodactylibacter sp.]|nr:hypothetical protein [Phaeodactylibacter sp.]
MKTFLIFLSLSFGLASWGIAQQIQADSDIEKAMAVYKEAHSQREKCEGYRIQVLATTNRRRMESTKWSFQKKMPYYKAFWTYKEPYYYVKAGAFVTRLEALHALEEIKRKFSGAYIVKDKMPCSSLF